MARFARNDIMSIVGEGAAPYDLAESYGPSLRLSELMGPDGDGDLDDLTLGYGTVQGDASLREAIAQRNGVTADDVVVTVGAAHALFLCAFVLCEPGDEAVMATPVFPPVRTVLDALATRTKILRLSFDNGYRPDLDEFRSLLSPKTRLVSIASPQNPSGVAFSRDTVQRMLGLMESVCPDAYLLVDETYREASYGEEPVSDSACSLSTRVISTASLSKSHGAPGLRIGWVITRDPELREQLTLGKFNTVVSCSPLDEALAVRVLQRNAALLAARRRHFAAALAVLEAWVKRNAGQVEWVRPNAGSICCIRLKPSARVSSVAEDFLTELERHGVRIANGTWFGDEDGVFRLGFGLLAPDVLERALDAMTSALSRTMSPA
jgi:aspartate/methionine/tyrosine aminotransferase